jgi:hypothetical protein
MTAEDWMKKLLSSEDSGLDLSHSSDPIIDMVTGAFTSLMAIAVHLDKREEEDKKQMVVDAATAKTIVLTPYLQSHRDCSICIQGGDATLTVDGKAMSLSTAELKSLSYILRSSLDDNAKMKRIGILVDNALMAGRASQNYEAAATLSQEQSNVIQR